MTARSTVAVVGIVAAAMVVIFASAANVGRERARTELEISKEETARSTALVSAVERSLGSSRAPRTPIRFSKIPRDRIDITTLPQVERPDGQIEVVLPNGQRWLGVENTHPGPERADVLPVMDFLNKHPALAQRFNSDIDHDALFKCRNARVARQGPSTKEYHWSFFVKASVKEPNGMLTVDEVSSETYPSDLDSEFYKCIVDELARVEFEPSDGVLTIGFEYPFCQKAAL